MGRREAEHETETTPASQKTPIMDVSRQARAVSVSFGPRNGKTGAVSVSFGPRNSKTRAAQVSTSPQNSTTRAAQVSTSTQNSKTRGGPGFNQPPKQHDQGGPGFIRSCWSIEADGRGRRNGRTRPRGRHAPRHHPVDPSPGVPIALEAHYPLVPSVDEVSHSPGMHTPLTSHGAARSCSRRVEVLRLARLLDTPAGSLRLAHRKTGGVFAPAGSDPYTW